MGKCSKDKRDIYYRKAKEAGYRARSAFKLIQLNDEFQLFKNSTRIVDLCAAPGGWSQVISQEIYRNDTNLTMDNTLNKIVAVDLMEMAPIPGVIQLRGDITSKQTADEIIKLFEGKKANLVLSDGAPDVMGMHDMDEYLQAQLVLAGLKICLNILENGGTFVAKIFRGKNVSLLYHQLSNYFEYVTCAKPKACRNSSFESFVVCQKFKYKLNEIDCQDRAKDLDSNYFILDSKYKNNSTNEIIGPNNFKVPFRACGDLNGDDADQSYPLDVDNGYKHREPLQKPINPPYKQSLELQNEASRMKKNKKKIVL